MRPLNFIILFFLVSCTATSTFNGSNSIKLSKSEIKLFDQEFSKYGLKDSDTLLDIGSGFGYIDEQIFRYYPNMFFVLEDIDIKYAKSNKGFVIVNGKTKYFKDNCKYVQGTNDSIPLASSSHKLILCRKTFHEFKNPTVMLKEIRRVLTNDGTLIIIEAIPKMPEEIDPYCKMKHLSKEELLTVFFKNNFMLVSADTITHTSKKAIVGNFNILKFKKNTSR